MLFCSSRLTLVWVFVFLKQNTGKQEQRKIHVWRGKSFVPPIIPNMAVCWGMVSLRLRVWVSKPQQDDGQTLTDAVRDASAGWVFSLGCNSQRGAGPGGQRLTTASSSVPGEAKFCQITSVWWTAMILWRAFPQHELRGANVVIRSTCLICNQRMSLRREICAEEQCTVSLNVHWAWLVFCVTNWDLWGFYPLLPFFFSFINSLYLIKVEYSTYYHRITEL